MHHSINNGTKIKNILISCKKKWWNPITKELTGRYILKKQFFDDIINDQINQIRYKINRRPGKT
jgi:hypothetical protein